MVMSFFAHHVFHFARDENGIAHRLTFACVRASIDESVRRGIPVECAPFVAVSSLIEWNNDRGEFAVESSDGSSLVAHLSRSRSTIRDFARRHASSERQSSDARDILLLLRGVPRCFDYERRLEIGIVVLTLQTYAAERLIDLTGSYHGHVDGDDARFVSLNDDDDEKKKKNLSED